MNYEIIEQLSPELIEDCLYANYDKCLKLLKQRCKPSSKLNELAIILKVSIHCLVIIREKYDVEDIDQELTHTFKNICVMSKGIIKNSNAHYLHMETNAKYCDDLTTILRDKMIKRPKI